VPNKEKNKAIRMVSGLVNQWQKMKKESSTGLSFADELISAEPRKSNSEVIMILTSTSRSGSRILFSECKRGVSYTGCAFIREGWPGWHDFSKISLEQLPLNGRSRKGKRAGTK
jgi:hypothetical protein